MSIEKLSRADAELQKFAVFNGGEHICIDLDQAPTTISVKTPDGKKVTFAFTERHQKPGHQCVDIQNHTMPKNGSGVPLQRGSFLGQGPTNAVCNEDDDSPTTLVVLSLPNLDC